MSLVLPFEAWPVADREMWRTLFAEGGPLDDRGPLVHLRETTRTSLAPRYGRWLRWLLHSDPDALMLAPGERASRDRLILWLEDLGHTAPMTRLAFLDGVLRLLTAGYPAIDWSAQRALRARVRSAAGRGTRSRKQGRILSSAALFEAGLRIADEATNRTRSALFQATDLRDGAMIALLSLLPMRRRALANLRLDESVFVTDDRIAIALPEELTKTGIPWEADVPAQALPVLHRYLDEARPLLLARGGGDTSHLWLDRNGNGLAPDYLGARIGQQTLRVTGVRVPPHFFRDAAATTLARISPQSARLIPPVLAHSGYRTAERHYIHAESIEAGRDYAALLRQMKGATR